MTNWTFAEMAIASIGDVGDLGIAHCKAVISLAGGPNDTFLAIEIVVPLAYRPTDAVAVIRARVREEVISGLVVAAGHLAPDRVT